ncbi:MAG: 3-hydroxyacyl-CoA dehydrogenase [Alphaproteobacteria bacterium]|nr:3-hydroxyacyl-CoA dehydrogenase [Alphaproteobacteria bacterium]
MPSVGIIGAGLIGRSWVMVFARAGWKVALTDTSAKALAAAPGLIKTALADQKRHDLVRDAKAALRRIRVVPSLEAAVSGADFVQECGPETLAAKRRLFRAIDRAAPAKTIVASSSSAIVASRYTKELAGRARCLVAHPVNPPHLVPVVELCGAPWTAAATIARARAIYEAIGQVPITVCREVEGFILNRLQGALLAEAFRLVGQGYVSAQDLDKTIKDGLGLRWSFMGPFETIELNAPGGIPDYCARYTGFYKRLARKPPKPAVYGRSNAARILKSWNAVPPGRHGAKSRWRDERLAALRAHKRAQTAFKD